MARRERYLVGLDVGTSKVTAVVGERLDGDGLDVVGVGAAESRGIRRGVVVNLEAAVDSIKKAIEEAELMAGVEIDTVRARFIRVAPSSLDIEIVSYIFAADWAAFLEIQEELLLRIMEIVDEVGTELAFPSQTVHLADDREPSRVPDSLIADSDLRVRT